MLKYYLKKKNPQGLKSLTELLNNGFVFFSSATDEVVKTVVKKNKDNQKIRGRGENFLNSFMRLLVNCANSDFGDADVILTKKNEQSSSNIDILLNNECVIELRKIKYYYWLKVIKIFREPMCKFDIAKLYIFAESPEAALEMLENKVGELYFENIFEKQFGENCKDTPLLVGFSDGEIKKFIDRYYRIPYENCFIVNPPVQKNIEKNSADCGQSL